MFTKTKVTVSFFSFLKLDWNQTVETFWIPNKISIVNSIQTGKDPKYTLKIFCDKYYTVKKIHRGLLQCWLYCREHLKYIWNVYCDVTSHIRDLHTTEVTEQIIFVLFKDRNCLITNLKHRCSPRSVLRTASRSLFEFRKKIFRSPCDATAPSFPCNNTRGNVSKISVNHTSDRQIGSKPTNHSPLVWHKEGLKVTLVPVIGGFRSDLSIAHKTDGNFGNVSAGVLVSKVVYQRKWW